MGSTCSDCCSIEAVWSIQDCPPCHLLCKSLLIFPFSQPVTDWRRILTSGCLNRCLVTLLLLPRVRITHFPPGTTIQQAVQVHCTADTCDLHPVPLRLLADLSLTSYINVHRYVFTVGFMFEVSTFQRPFYHRVVNGSYLGQKRSVHMSSKSRAADIAAINMRQRRRNEVEFRCIPDPRSCRGNLILYL